MKKYYYLKVILLFSVFYTNFSYSSEKGITKIFKLSNENERFGCHVFSLFSAGVVHNRFKNPILTGGIGASGFFLCPVIVNGWKEANTVIKNFNNKHK